MSFKQLKIPESCLKALLDLGYENPSPIQLQSIPAMLEGRDVMAQAQTGTGKTAAFALPILANLNLKQHQPQALVITPTRELAIQVAEAFQSYAKYLPGFHVLPIYGGSQYESQIKALKRGVHVVVGTPGRVMDHMRRKTFSMEGIKTLVLDEADEMLKMGFIDDVKWILDQIPQQHQIALFSATMPPSIQKIAQQYLEDPLKFHIEPSKTTVSAIEQQYVMVPREHKLEALTRFLEVEEFEAAIIFVRTKIETTELAEKLEARGYAVAALNGDMAQALREKVIARVKQGSLDIIVATEVAARGLDVERMEYVINYDIPQDPESYVHRIGRTGRAGRQGKALLFVTPRERHALKHLERTLGTSIPLVEPPSANKVTQQRSQQFIKKVLQAMDNQYLDQYQYLVDQILDKYSGDARDVAAALACLMHKEKPLTIKELPKQSYHEEKSRDRYQENRRRSGGFSEGRRADRSGKKNADSRRGESRDDRYGDSKRSESRSGRATDSKRSDSRDGRSYDSKRSESSGSRPADSKRFEGRDDRRSESKRSEGRRTDKPMADSKPKKRKKY